ncbi:MAG: tetratricopeptide repeat protein [Leptolyngbyaceae bacterium]|nr:tetratricopeptide repeat protein [Leptolyngbyaceae bacterium]
MEIINFVAWLSVVAIALGFGAGVMIWAYLGKGSKVALFTDAVLMSPALKKSDVASIFHQGYDAFQSGDYQLALESFTEVIQARPESPEAHHNRGLVLANLLKDNQAVKDLTRAAELYAARDNGTAITIIRDQLQKLKDRD